MGERRHAPHASRLHIPERHLWTPEAAAQYLNDDGLIDFNKQQEPNFELRQVPLISPDYPVVDIPAFMEDIKSLFIPGARFPQTYLKRTVYIDERDGMDVTTVAVMPVPMPNDVEHVQGIENYVINGRKISERAFAFCDDPERKIEIPRLPHNVKTAIYAPVPPPEEVMESHRIGHRLCLNLYKAALIAVNRGYGYVGRAEAIKNGVIEPRGYSLESPAEAYEEIIDKEAAKYFKERSRKYRQAVEIHKQTLQNEMPDDSYFAKVGAEAIEARPARIINILSKVATDRPWQYADFIQGKVDFQTAQNTHKNRMGRRLAREAMLRAA